MERTLLLGCILLSILGGGSRALFAQDVAPGVDLQFVGHECFLLTTSGGTRILMDPYDDRPFGLASVPSDLAPDAVTVSHNHADHSNIACAPNTAQILRTAGTYNIGDVTVTGYAGFEGSPFGPSKIAHVVFVFDVAGVKIVHLGDSGPVTDPEALAAITNADVVIVNIDGYVIPAGKILPFLTEIRARTVLIGHYTVVASAPFSGAPTVDQFFATLPEGVVRVKSPENSLRVIPGMPEQILALTPSALTK